MRSLPSVAWRGSVFAGTVTGALAAFLAFSFSAGAAPVVVTSLVGPLQAAAGQGWAKHPDQSAGGSEAFVEGPATPPAGRGSLKMSVAASTDRALIFTVPNPGTGATAPGDEGPIKPVPWAELGGSSYSTYTTATTDTATSVTVLKFVGYQDFNSNNPLLSTGFTTLNFEPSLQGPVNANSWQTWTASGTSTVWQSNATGNFCVQATPCTLTEFAAHYSDGAWGQVQIGLGTFPPGGAAVSSFVDNVTIAEGEARFSYDFDIPAAPSSSPAPTTSAPTTTTPASSTASSPGSSTASSSAFVPGPGATGDSGNTNTPAWLIAASALGVLTLGSVATARRRRARHPHHS